MDTQETDVQINTKPRAKKDRLFSFLAFLYKFPALKKRKAQDKPRNVLEDIVGGVVMVLSIVAGLVTCAALMKLPPFGNDPHFLFDVLKVDLVLLMALALLNIRRVFSVLRGSKRIEKQKKAAGVRIQTRLVMIFGFLALIPALLMAVFSVLFFHYGIQSWFNERVKSAVGNANAVAEAYLDEHYKVVRADIWAAANDFDRQAALISANPEDVKKILETQSTIRNFSEIILFSGGGNVIEEYGLRDQDAYMRMLKNGLDKANEGDVVVITDTDSERVHALVKLNNFIDAYLMVGRFVDPVVLSHVERTRKASEEYAYLEGQFAGLRVTVSMIYIVVALLLVVAASWVGLHFARQIVLPISDMIYAAERVSTGDLTVKLNEKTRFKDFSYLAQSFNTMTDEIKGQRNALMHANRQLDTRRRFTEAILATASHGVIAVNNKNEITLVNGRTADLLEHDQNELVGNDINKFLLGIGEYIADVEGRGDDGVFQFETPIVHSALGPRVLLVRIALEKENDVQVGAVITLDDITDLQSVQRKAAWSDVARRIAHEIKNPLTPIQLSAERLQRKYAGQIKEDDREIFNLCTSTIVKHVGDIGRMVKEFSSFARMPEPQMNDVNPLQALKDVILFEDHAHDQVEIEFVPLLGDMAIDDEVYIHADSQQIRQVFTNLLQNAIEAVQSIDNNGVIHIYSYRSKQRIFIIFKDNGPGFPSEIDRSRLSEPYVTHKEKGTGLGLAIVKKILEDHNGSLYMGLPEFLHKALDKDGIAEHIVSDEGACVVASFPIKFIKSEHKPNNEEFAA
ncbi:MAG: ATP-binding protein [Alphaproteobacteria bacterium]|nr:ATP-binding protein [Alphaproteobacteria bacterium]